MTTRTLTTIITGKGNNSGIFWNVNLARVFRAVLHSKVTQRRVFVDLDDTSITKIKACDVSVAFDLDTFLDQPV